MRIVTKTIYKFQELSDKAKEKARDWYRSCEDSFWYENIFEDANTIAKLMGIEIKQRPYQTVGGQTRYEPAIFFSGFSSQGDGACFEGSYRYAAGSVGAILDYAPMDGELYQIVGGLYALQRSRRFRVTAVVTHSGHYCHSGCTDISIDGL